MSAALRPWSKMEFGNNVERIRALKENLALMQLHPFSQEQYDREKHLKEELEITMLREEMYLHQRSRINWLNFGDKNSAFFHATVIQRRQRNEMSKIRDKEGHWFTEEANINGQLKVLIPKVLAPESLAQFQPISLCNFNLKVITKVMANRLKGLLNGFVSVNQSAFVPGRMIQDCVIVAHEAFHFLKGFC
ncbi:hypothetical protein RHSIM_Rhsim09G0067200 [Rhododendron simsii]|uniref:Reverse transcriptase domain-containing protein n=1 Tax=Rhododendron simsii TaxID=118357 RepID=A0A834LET3_RHOSS|nr:hypothetical protein RHSIM_Rhsim09G0067200 [Rhododendron simsii]